MYTECISDYNIAPAPDSQNALTKNVKGCTNHYKWWFSSSAQSGKDCGCRRDETAITGPGLLQYCWGTVFVWPPATYYAQADNSFEPQIKV